MWVSLTRSGSHYAVIRLSYNTRRYSLGRLQKTDKKSLSSTHCDRCYIHAPPPMGQSWFVYGTFEVGVQVKCSQYRVYLSKNPTLFQGERGVKVCCRIQNVQSVPGLLATIALFEECHFHNVVCTNANA